MPLRGKDKADRPSVLMSFHLGGIRLCHSSWPSQSRRRTSPETDGAETDDPETDVAETEEGDGWRRGDGPGRESQDEWTLRLDGFPSQGEPSVPFFLAFAV